MSARATLAAVALCLSLASPSRADLVVGVTDPTTGLGSPFSVGYLGEFQQVYAARAFGTAPVQTIDALSFATIKDFNVGPAIAQSLTITVSLSTIAAGPGGLSTNFAGNLGADNTVVFSGTLIYHPLRDFTTDFTIPITTFIYDSSKGNLLLDVNVTAAAGGPDNGDIFNFFAADDTSNLVSRVYQQQIPGGVTVADNIGLVTQFGSSSVNFLAPEPSSLVLMGMGVVMLGAARHRYRRDNRTIRQ